MSGHRCHRAERCCRSERKPGGLIVGAQIHTETGLCLDCTRHVEDGIAGLPRDYVDLHRALVPSRAAGERIRGTRTPPAPLIVSRAALAAEIVAEAAAWAEPVAELLGIDWDSDAMDHHTRPGAVLARACRILESSLSVLLSLRGVEVARWDREGEDWTPEATDGIEGAVRLLGYHQRVHGALGRGKLVHKLDIPCPRVNCEVVALVRHNGSDVVVCQACGTQWTRDEWDWLTRVATAA